jgi:hypothetical protein
MKASRTWQEDRSRARRRLIYVRARRRWPLSERREKRRDETEGGANVVVRPRGCHAMCCHRIAMRGPPSPAPPDDAARYGNILETERPPSHLEKNCRDTMRILCAAHPVPVGLRPRSLLSSHPYGQRGKSMFAWSRSRPSHDENGHSPNVLPSTTRTVASSAERRGGRGRSRHALSAAAPSPHHWRQQNHDFLPAWLAHACVCLAWSARNPPPLCRGWGHLLSPMSLPPCACCSLLCPRHFLFTSQARVPSRTN